MAGDLPSLSGKRKVIGCVLNAHWRHTGGILGLGEAVGWGQGLGCRGLAPWRPLECVSGASCLAVPATGGLLFFGLKDDCCPLSLLPPACPAVG